MKDPNSNQTVSAASTETAVYKPIQRWSAARKRDVVLRLLRGESIEAISRQVAVEPYRLEQWRERALAGLVEEQRSTLLLVVLEGLTYREVAEVQGVPIGTVMSRLARARSQIKAYLDGERRVLRRVK